MIRSFAVVVGLTLALPLAAESSPTGSGNNATPGERYRHLTMVLNLTEGATEQFVDLLAPDHQLASTAPLRQLLDTAANPVTRIADPDTMLQGIAQIVSFGLRSSSAIGEDLRQIEAQHPAIVGSISGAELVEETLLLRMTIVEAIQRSDLNDDRGRYLSQYSDHTTRLRNDLETVAFAAQLGELADQYTAELEGTHGMLARFIASEMDPFAIESAISRAARMNVQSRQEIAQQSAARLAELMQRFQSQGQYAGY